MFSKTRMRLLIAVIITILALPVISGYILDKKINMAIETAVETSIGRVIKLIPKELSIIEYKVKVTTVKKGWFGATHKVIITQVENNGLTNEHEEKILNFNVQAHYGPVWITSKADGAKELHHGWFGVSQKITQILPDNTSKLKININADQKFSSGARVEISGYVDSVESQELAKYDFDGSVVIKLNKSDRKSKDKLEVNFVGAKISSLALAQKVNLSGLEYASEYKHHDKIGAPILTSSDLSIESLEINNENRISAKKINLNMEASDNSSAIAMDYYISAKDINVFDKKYGQSIALGKATISISMPMVSYQSYNLLSNNFELADKAAARDDLIDEYQKLTRDMAKKKAEITLRMVGTKYRLEVDASMQLPNLILEPEEGALWCLDDEQDDSSKNFCFKGVDNIYQFISSVRGYLYSKLNITAHIGLIDHAGSGINNYKNIRPDQYIVRMMKVLGVKDSWFLSDSDGYRGFDIGHLKNKLIINGLAY